MTAENHAEPNRTDPERELAQEQSLADLEQVLGDRGQLLGDRDQVRLDQDQARLDAERLEDTSGRGGASHAFDDRQARLDRSQATGDTEQESLDHSQTGRDDHQEAIDQSRELGGLPTAQQPEPPNAAELRESAHRRAAAARARAEAALLRAQAALVRAEAAEKRV